MGKVRVGFFSFTEVTDPGEHRAYNEWHQLDHMPEQFPLNGVLFGQRWVSTPGCRRARAVDRPPLDAVHYMTLYLMAEPVDRTLDEFGALGDELRVLGRFHPHRRARLSGPLSLAASAAAPRVLVSAEAVPYRPNRGVYVVVRERPPAPPGPADPADPADRADPADEMAARLLEAAGVAGVWTFVSDPRFERHRWRPGSRSITVCYLDEEPLEVAPSLGALVGNPDRPPDRPVLFAGPFETITPWRWDWFDNGER